MHAYKFKLFLNLSLDCSCKPTCWCHDKPYSVSGISVLKTRIEEIRNELNNVWEIKTV